MDIAKEKYSIPALVNPSMGRPGRVALTIPFAIVTSPCRD